jgi:hypothetical protein
VVTLVLLACLAEGVHLFGGLRQAAHEGKVYGILTYGYPKPALAELIGMLLSDHASQTRTV